jgi:hypothetical protein
MHRCCFGVKTSYSFEGSYRSAGSTAPPKLLRIASRRPSREFSLQARDPSRTTSAQDDVGIWVFARREGVLFSSSLFPRSAPWAAVLRRFAANKAGLRSTVEILVLTHTLDALRHPNFFGSMSRRLSREFSLQARDPSRTTSAQDDVGIWVSCGVRGFCSRLHLR